MKAEHGSCSVHFTWCLLIVPEGVTIHPSSRRKSRKPLSPPPPPAPSSAPQQSPTRCLAPLQAVKEAVSIATGPPASWARPSSCRSLPGTGPGHSAPCPLLRSWMQPQAPMGAPTLGGRGRNFKLLKYSSKAPMWLVKPPKIITVKQLLL